jgi:hypothetical protein
MAIRPSLARIVLARIVLGAVFALAQHHAFAASSLLGTIADVLRFPAAVPLPVFDGIKPKPLPGAPVLGLTERNYSGVAVVDVSRMRVCAIPDATPPLRLPIAGFLQRFSAAENADELRLLFGLTDLDIQNIDSYEVLLTGGVSFTSSFNEVEKNFAAARKDASCPQGQSAPPRMIVRSVVADLTVEFRGRQPFPPSIADRARADGGQDVSLSDDNVRLKVLLGGRLVALNLR